MAGLSGGRSRGCHCSHGYQSVGWEEERINLICSLDLGKGVETSYVKIAANIGLVEVIMIKNSLPFDRISLDRHTLTYIR